MSSSNTSAPLRVLQLNGTAYGWVLAVTTLLALVLVAHHPLAAVPSWAHGMVILLILLLTTGFSGFAWRLGIAHPLVMAGWLSLLFGATALIGAALVEGFVVPGLTGGLPPFGSLWVQAELRLGAVLTAASALFWGHALLHHRGGAFWVGLLGIAAGGFSAVFVLTLTARVNPPLLLGYMATQAAWALTVAFWMIRGLKRPG